METKIKTIHEESNNSDENRISIGVLFNYSQDNTVYDVLFFRYRKNMYVFFKTITDLIDYSLYGENERIIKSYMSEDVFDEHYDNPINGLFRDIITWTE